MAKVCEIINFIESIAPLDSAEEWDNTGWQVYLGNEYAEKIMLSLSVTDDVIDQAIEQGCDLIISHHPLIFGGLKKINNSLHSHKPIIKAIQNNIQVYCAHTNLDKAPCGTSNTIAELLDIKVTKTIDELVKVGQLEQSLDLNEFITKLKQALNVKNIKLINNSNIHSVKRIAICAGSGIDFISKIEDIDMYITGDVKYHAAIDTNNFAIIDAGHFATERPVLNRLKIAMKHISIDIVIAAEKEPWQVL